MRANYLKEMFGMTEKEENESENAFKLKIAVNIRCA
jgi:hypothetical protein